MLSAKSAFCPRYIYPILNWDDSPGMAAGVVLGGCVLMPVIQVATIMIKTIVIIIKRIKMLIIMIKTRLIINKIKVLI